MNASLRLPEIAYHKDTLPNGLDVIVRRDDRLPMIAVNLWYHVGSKNERDGQRGFAHLFEHLMFEGSEHFPGDFFRPLQPLGAHVNGSTSPDRTNYFVDLPAAHLELALAMESDRMGHLLPALTEEKLRIQKGVVTNEYRQNYANRPYGQVPRLLAEALYPPDHPYRWPTIGAMEDVEAASRSDVDGFFRRFYVPSNASLCLVGDLDGDRAMALADRYFGPIPGGAPALSPLVPESALSGDVTIRLHDRVGLDRLYLVWHTVAQFHPDDAPLALAGDILARGRSSRLYRRLVLEDELAQDVLAYQSSRELAGTFAVVVTMRPGKSWEQARNRVDAEIADLARQVEPEDRDRARNGRLSALIHGLESIGGFGGVADRLNAYNVYLGDPGRITTDFERFDRATTEDVARVTGHYLARRDGGPNRVELLVSGRQAGTGTEVRPIDRTRKPEAAAAVPYRAPVPECRTLRCGAELWVIPRRNLPVVTASLAVPAGAGSHGSDRGGLAAMTAAMLDEGTASRSAVALAREAEAMASTLWSSAGWDGSYVGLRCLSPHLDETLELAVDILRNPAFPDHEWQRVRGQALAAQRAARDRAETLAGRALLQAIYGLDHPYRCPSGGTEATIDPLELGALRDFHADRYRPEGSAWIVAGDVEPDILAARLDAAMGDWTGRAEPPEAPAEPPRPSRRRIILVHRPDAPQAALRVGQVGIRRRDDDFNDLLVLNQVLGGQFISRLNAKLREEKGMTYGVRSSFDARRGAGPLTVSAAVQTDRVAEALVDIVREIEDLLGDRPASPRERDDARRSLLEGRARSFETPSDLVSQFAGLFLHGLPPDYHAQFPDRLAAVGPESLASAASRLLHPSGLVAVIVADADQVLGPLDRLGWAEIEQVDADAL